MINRCYSKNFLVRSSTYIGCSVAPEWLYLSNFIKWVDSQPNRDWENCHLDKDLLVEGNKRYSTNTCVFINAELNSFLTNSAATRGDYLLGVCLREDGVTFRSRCCDPFRTTDRHIGDFKTELEAHKAWQERKHLYACQLAELQSDLRIANALRTRYSPDKDWTKR
jgi:hypothetical protein